jgi:hypothetical protein
MTQQAPMLEIDPEKAPRTSAIILILCGLLGVSFFVINIAYTGDDPYQTWFWDEEDQHPLQEGYHIMPNLWRGRSADLDEAPEDEIDPGLKVKKQQAAKKATTGPAGKTAAPGGSTPGAPAAPAAPPAPNPFTIDKPGETTPAK